MAKMGRPKIENPKYNDIKIRVDDKMKKDLDDYCRKTNETKAEVIRLAIQYYLENKK